MNDGDDQSSLLFAALQTLQSYALNVHEFEAMWTSVVH